MLPLSVFASFNGVLPLTTSGSMPAPLTGPTITLSNYDLTAGQTATVTFTFPAAPLNFTASDTSATNGTLSNLASTTNPDVYTATFTPTANTNAATNTISVKGLVMGTNYHDASFNEPYSLAFDGTNMWVTNSNSSTIDKITPSGTITVFSGFDGPSGIAFDGSHLWVTNYGGPSGVQSGNGTIVDKVSLAGSIIASTTVALAPTAIAFDGTNMWVASYVDGTSPGVVTEIASTSAILRTATTSPGPNAIAFDGMNMWTANFGSNDDGSGHSVTKISPTGTSTTYVGAGWNGPTGIAFDGTNMWTANYGLLDYEGPGFTDLVLGINGDSVTKVSSSGAMTLYTGTGGEPAAIAYDGTNMWTANYDGTNSEGGSVSEVGPSGSIVTYYGVGYNPAGIAYDGTNMWVANSNNLGVPGGDSVTKITGTISPSASANYVVDTIQPSDSGVSGGSVTLQVENLNAMGNTKVAQALQAQWPTLFSPTSVSAATSSTATTSIVSTTTPVFKRYLERGMKGSDVLALQQYLNSHGFTIAASGPGSPGRETDYFGTLTFNALVKFQEAHSAEILAPFNLSTGTGVLGPSTVAFIAS